MTITEAISVLNSGNHDTYPVATEADCVATERAIEHALPPSYRTFVQTFSNGAYLYQTEEVSAVGTGSKQISPIQDGIASVRGSILNELIPYREGSTIKAGQLIPFHNDSNGNAWCFIAEGATGEYPVAYLDTTGEKLYGKLPTFTAWLEILIAQQEEVIRSLYDEDVIYDELGLG